MESSNVVQNRLRDIVEIAESENKKSTKRSMLNSLSDIAAIARGVANLAGNGSAARTLRSLNKYIADYIEEERKRGHSITSETIIDAIDAWSNQ